MAAQHLHCSSCVITTASHVIIILNEQHFTLFVQSCFLSQLSNQMTSRDVTDEVMYAQSQRFSSGPELSLELYKHDINSYFREKMNNSTLIWLSPLLCYQKIS